MGEQSRLLVVDDDPEVAWGLGRFLARKGWAVSACGDGVEAIELLEGDGFDAVVTDVQMPRLNGLAVVEWVRRHRPSTAIIVITAFGSSSVRQACLQKGAYHYLDKPVDPELLLDLLEAGEERNTFSGSITGVDIFDYVQMLLVTRRKILVEVCSRDGERSRLFIEGGDVVHAECSGMRGERAFCHCLSFEGGSFSSLPWVDPPARTIERRGEFLLLDAAREKDETSQIEVGSGGREAQPLRELPEGFDASFDMSAGEEPADEHDAKETDG
jgi:CheY-like chemotaxis protein